MRIPEGQDRCDHYVDTSVYPTWICAARGHNAKIKELSDSGIAGCWYIDQARDELGDSAGVSGSPPHWYCGTRAGGTHGVPDTAAESPNYLYRRTTRDAAFSILQSEFTAGHGESGKFGES